MEEVLHRVGVDVGGTFTDIVTVTEGNFVVTKIPSTPDSPDDGVLDGLVHTSGSSGMDFDHVEFIAHGTTVATNAVLERDWSETALLTTEGFRDVLEIGRQTRPSLYDLRAEKPEPIVPRDRRFEVVERLDERGRVITPLDISTVDDAVATIADTEVESVAVSLLFSFENDEHERRVGEAFENVDLDVQTSISSVVLPEIREYERTLATSLNAALKPVMHRYIDRLEHGISELGVPADLRVMQSNGGVTGAEQVSERPINTLLSGPAAGVQGAAHVARLAGYEDVITMDMGGTSCDVSMVEGGEPIISTEVTVGDYPVGVPMIEVHTIGSGGGSIAWLDSGGALRVGPRSAGANPGPICYGRGGTEPTVTDAHLELGRIDTDSFLSKLDPTPEATRQGIDSQIADPMGKTIEDAATGILEVADSNMERALRVVSVERGHDPREFALVAFGGAGPLHAPAIARSLDIPRVLIPRTAGVLSALGLLITDLVHDFSASMVRPWEDVDAESLEERFERFAAEGCQQLRGEGVTTDNITTERSLEMRYTGQSFTLRVPVPAELDEDALGHVAQRFHERHDTRYGHASPDEPVEIVTIRSRARGSVRPPDLRLDDGDKERSATPGTTREVHFDGVAYDASIFARSGLDEGTVIDGPAVIEGSESTILIHPEQRARVDSYGTVVIETESESA